MARAGNVSALLYLDGVTYQPWIYLREDGAVAGTHVMLPADPMSPNQWWGASYVLAESGELTVLSGNGPVYARTYQLSGGPPATQASLLSMRTYGDTDSRAGSLTRLTSGGLVGVWRQQGQAGAQGMGVVHRTAQGAWSSVFPIGLMPTTASKQVVVQHPSDGSIWIFNNADASGAIGAAHLTETAGSISVDWVNSMFIFADGKYGPDPENPDLVGSPDPSDGTIVLAYQSAERRIFSTSPVLTGSHIALARIAASGAKTFASLPLYVERIAPIGLVVAPGQVWLSYRPIDLVTLAFGTLHVSVLRDGIWSEPIVLGTLSHRYNTVWYGRAVPTFVAKMLDGRLHWFVVDPPAAPAVTSTPTPTVTATPDPTPSPSDEPSPGPSEEPTASPSPEPSPTTEPSPSPEPTSGSPGGKGSPKCRTSKNARCG